MVVAAGMVRMGMITRTYAICGIMEAMVGVLRGLGHSVGPMVVSLMGSCVLRLIWMVTVFPTVATPDVLFLAFPVTWAITSGCHLIFFFKIRKKCYRLVGYQI